MAFMVVDGKPKEGIVYVIKMVLDDGTIIYKIGITTRNDIYDRLSEIVIGMFKVLRYIPRTTVKKFSRSTKCEYVEQTLLTEYKEKQYVFDVVFGGHTEFISGVCEEDLLSRYDKLLMEEIITSG